MTPERLAEIEKRNIGCPQCEEGRPHSHDPRYDYNSVLNKTVEELIAACRELTTKVEQLGKERDEQKKAADYWFKEACNRHNVIVKELEAENDRLRKELERLRYEIGEIS